MCCSQATCPDPVRFQEEVCGNYSTTLNTDNFIWKTLTNTGSLGLFVPITLSVYALTESTPVVVAAMTPAGNVILTPPGSEIIAGTTKSFVIPAVNCINVHAVTAGDQVIGKFTVIAYHNVY
ncbi:hypothetical protein SAMN05444487_12016 [Marininema mesophilum]|uniref:Uncharacterized protein n=1 Tax=Marininema mesophilum TaxID=1048340 RepID=A0A1H3C5B0_9BACL|nr:hypothetical protein [Marininema mesophilum]SDX49343.1 hypothetical protein SAMN05444487_12016 [Marininema mesophilum]